jgi:hypothetical protein
MRQKGFRFVPAALHEYGTILGDSDGIYKQKANDAK